MKTEKSFLDILAEKVISLEKRHEVPYIKYEFKSDLIHHIAPPQPIINSNTEKISQLYNHHQAAYPIKNRPKASGSKPKAQPKTAETYFLLHKLDVPAQLIIVQLKQLGAQWRYKNKISIEEIKKEHRRLARINHPDLASNTIGMKKALANMADINSLFEDLYADIKKLNFSNLAT